MKHEYRAVGVQRIETLERENEDLRRSIALLKVELEDLKKRSNAFVDLTERRIDLIYSQVVKELKHALGQGSALVVDESDVDRQLARLLSAGLKVQIAPESIDFNALLSGQLNPGRIRSPLTIYGFRVDRSRAQEFGDRIQVRSVDESTPGAAVFGPYKRMTPGRYRVTALLIVDTDPGRSRRRGDISLDIYSPTADTVVAIQTLTASKLAQNQSVSVEFEWTAENAEGVVEVRLHQSATISFSLTEVIVERL